MSDLDFPVLMEVPTVFNPLCRLPSPPNVQPVGYKVFQLMKKWRDVPEGFITDLASVPGLVDNIIPRDGLWRAAAVKHDYDYACKRGPRVERDVEFYNLMLEYGTEPEIAGLMYRQVRMWGWRPWNKSTGIPDIRPLYYEPETYLNSASPSTTVPATRAQT